MAGHPADEDRRSLRLAQITQYIEQLYTDRFEEWISEDASRLDFVARHAMAVAEYKNAHLPLSATFLEAWTEIPARGFRRRTAVAHQPLETRGSFPVPEVPGDGAPCPQHRLRVLPARGLPDPRHASADDARGSVPGAQPRRNQPDRNLARAVERTTARLRAFHIVAYRQDRPLRPDLHSGIQQAAQGARRLPPLQASIHKSLSQRPAWRRGRITRTSSTRSSRRGSRRSGRTSWRRSTTRSPLFASNWRPPARQTGHRRPGRRNCFDRQRPFFGLPARLWRRGHADRSTAALLIINELCRIWCSELSNECPNGASKYASAGRMNRSDGAGRPQTPLLGGNGWGLPRPGKIGAE